MAEANQGLNLPERITGIVVAGGAFSAVAVFLGRLWTSTYFDYFGLPTSDLALEVDDYAFRTKEVLLMLLVAAAVAGVIVWKRETLRVASGWQRSGTHPEPRTRSGSKDQQGDARTPTGTWDVLVAWARRRFWAVLLGLALGALVVFGVMAFREWRWVESHWRWLAVGLGLAVGLAVGILVTWIRSQPSRGALVVFSVLVLLVVGLVPPSIVRLARASAANDVRTQNLAHAVIEFTDEAPEPIRRADSPKRSARVYIVLLTPKRIAVAFPYPCTQVATQMPAAGQPGVCDILAFDREQVRSVRIFGRGGRPANDTRDTAEPVVLEVIEDDLSPRTVYHQGFDFAATQSVDLDCGDVTLEDEQGVWFRLMARQAGRVDLPNPDGRASFYAASPDDEAACREIERGHGVRLGVGEELLVFVTRPTAGEEPRGVVEFSYAPLAVHATDCQVVIDRDRPSRRALDCPEAGGEVLSFLFSVPGPANASVAVEVTAPAGDTTACPPELVARTPQVLLSGFELSASECRGTPDESGRYSILYPAPQPLAAGPWTLAVCTERDGGIEIDSAVVTSTALTPAGEAPPPTAEGAAAPPDGSASALLTPGSHDPAFPCPTPRAEAAGG